ncbi:hypothetical protein ACQY0O_000578 [Thecaphora frezii]
MTILDIKRDPPYSIFTHSIGANAAGHSLLDKLKAAASVGFDGVELFQDDLDTFANSEEFRGILDAQNHSTAVMTPPDSPPSTGRQLVDPTGPPSPSTASPSSSLTAKPHRRQADLCARRDDGSYIIGEDGLPMTYNAHGLCTANEHELEMAAARYLRTFCASLGLAVYCLQPLRDFEGWTKPEARRHAMQRARSRFRVMEALGADLLLICSNAQPASQTTGDIGAIGRDLAALADHAEAYGSIMMGDGVKKPIRIGFEALSWGTHIDLWSQAWSAVQAADRRNVGLILDSFNTLGKQYADPCSPTGIVQGPDTYGALMASLEDMGRVPADKIFFLQIGDARKLDKPLTPSPSAEEPRPARMIWSRGNRLYPCEEHLGAFLPVHDFMTAAIEKAGYRGPWSIEVFNHSLLETGAKVPIEHARRARDGLDRLTELVYK